MTSGAATGQAYLKTGTLSDTRALAGYVRAQERPRLRGVDDRHRPGGGEGNAGARLARRVGRQGRLGARPLARACVAAGAIVLFDDLVRGEQQRLAARAMSERLAPRALVDDQLELGRLLEAESRPASGP